MASKEMPAAAGTDADFFRRAPKQKRSSEKVERILAATAELLEELPFEHVTARLIAERAKITIPTFYGYFENRDAVFATLGLTYIEEALEINEALAADVSLKTWEEVLDASVDRYVTWFRERIGLRALWYSGHLDKLVVEAERAGNDSIAQLTRVHFAALTKANASQPPQYVYVFLVELIDAMLAFGFQSDPKGDQQVFDEIKVAARAYLGVYLSASAAGGATATKRPSRAKK